MSDGRNLKDRVEALEETVELLCARLGIDPVAVKEDADAALARGADAAALSEPPAEPEGEEGQEPEAQ